MVLNKHVIVTFSCAVMGWQLFTRRTNSSSALFPPVHLELAGYDAQKACGPPKAGDSGTLFPEEMDNTGQFCKNGRVWAKHCCIINSAWLQASQGESKAWSLPCPWLYSVAISFLHILWCFPQLLWSHAHVGTIWWHSWPADTTAYCAAQDHLCLPVLPSLLQSTCFPSLSCITEKFTCC